LIDDQKIVKPRLLSHGSYVKTEFFLFSAKLLLNNALLGFDSFYNAA